MASFVVGDFDGDGRTDIGRYYINGFNIDTEGHATPIWWFAYSPNARAAFTGARNTGIGTPAAWSGHFAAGSGVIWWNEDEFDIGIGTAPNARLSRQAMK